ncbi:MAG: hypothetical protein PHO01_10015 [Desulfotomaculaceae bacterium]|nr:hypothetical protein [Desulfotomaculaceae bacterium]
MGVVTTTGAVSINMDVTTATIAITGMVVITTIGAGAIMIVSAGMDAKTNMDTIIFAKIIMIAITIMNAITIMITMTIMTTITTMTTITIMNAEITTGTAGNQGDGSVNQEKPPSSLLNSRFTTYLPFALPFRAYPAHAEQGGLVSPALLLAS